MNLQLYIYRAILHAVVVTLKFPRRPISVNVFYVISTATGSRQFKIFKVVRLFANQDKIRLQAAYQKLGQDIHHHSAVSVLSLFLATPSFRCTKPRDRIFDFQKGVLF